MAVRDVVMAAAGAGAGAASPTFVASASNHTASASLVINKPTGTVEGDLMLAVLSSPAGTNDATFTSTGWSTLYTYDNDNNGGGGVLYKVAGASEGGSYTFAGNNAQFIGSIVTYRNAVIGLATPYVLGAGTVVASGMTIPAGNSLFFAFYQHKDNAVTFSAPSGMTSVVSNASVGGSYNLFSELRGSGATGTRTSTVTGGPADPTGFTFFITPASFSQIGPFPIGQATTQSGTTTTALTINKPTGTREGDLMVAYLLGGGGTQSAPGWVAPSGWTLVANSFAARPLNALAYKVAGAGEPSDYLFTSTTSRTLAGSIVTHRNAAWDAIAGPITTGTSPLVVTAVTPTENYARVVGIASRDVGNVTITGPAGMSSLVTQNDATTPSWLIEQDDSLAAASVSSGTRSFVVASTTNVSGILHTIKPAASYTKYATYGSRASGFSTSGTTSVSAAVTYPAEIPAGRIIVLAAAAFGRGDAPTITLPAGFTQLASFTSSASGEPAVLVAYKVADGTEGGTQLNVAGTPGTGGGLAAAVVVAIAAETPSVGSVGTGSATTTVTANSITATQNDLLIFVGALDLGQSAGTASFTPPAGYTEIVDVFADAGGSQQDGAFVVAYKEGSSAGATGSVTATATAAGGTKGVLIRVPGK